MRLILHNPHNKIFFGQTILDFLARNNISKKSQKHRYILDFLGKKKIKFGIYLDYKGSSLPIFLHKPIFIKIEAFFWLLIKKINPFNVKIIDDINKLKKDDVFFSFSLTTLDTDYHGIDDISDKDIIKIFHFTHFVQNTSLIAQNFERLRGDFIVAENNLFKNSDYFNNFFKNYNKDVYTLPFTYAKRYINSRHFEERQNKCLSVGAIINIHDYKGLFNDFSSFYKHKIDTLQPLRKEILHKAHDISKYIDTMNSNFSPIPLSILQKIKKMIFGFKHTYFKFDMVEKFNQYKMFICGEEINDMPGIGFVEGMACGCAYIGKIDAMYTDLGLIPGIHYIGHNGTLDDTIKKIEYYQNHTDELETIAKNGHDFVRKHLNGEIVAEKFYNDLIQLNKNLIVNNYNKDNLVFNSSFVDKGDH